MSIAVATSRDRADKPALEMKFENIQLEGYQHHPFIKFTVAV